jgi:hypothetical protein
VRFGYVSFTAEFCIIVYMVVRLLYVSINCVIYVYLLFCMLIMFIFILIAMYVPF